MIKSCLCNIVDINLEVLMFFVKKQLYIFWEHNPCLYQIFLKLNNIFLSVATTSLSCDRCFDYLIVLITSICVLALKYDLSYTQTG